MRPILTSGLTLFEVLLSLLLLSLVLLGLEVMELSALRFNRHAYFSSLAEQQLHNFEERLRLVGEGSDFEQQLAAWQLENTLLLPQSASHVEGVFPRYLITLCWMHPQEEKNACLRETFIL